MIASRPITAIVIDPSNPSTMFASTESQAVDMSRGVYKSTDGGAVRSPVESGLGTKNVYCLAIDPVNPSTVYAGGLFDIQDRPMFKTTNGGTSWVSISAGLSVLSVDEVAADPLVSGTLLIAQATGARKSTNGGASFSQRPSGWAIPGVDGVEFRGARSVGHDTRRLSTVDLRALLACQ